MVECHRSQGSNRTFEISAGHGWREGTAAKTISGRAYRHTATYYAYSCSVDWQGALMVGGDLVRPAL
ncbi:hypothetical protein [Desulfosporosinus sp. BG]|uniref:hypothetical protein n=1 Tax=Desulfosporosinus sp. BG TaxID=1633135 RepID=UPI00114D0C57|nr:hypothetical protein [Desulfosporosinus sp. BG]